MKAIETAKNLWILLVGGFIVVVIVVLVIAGIFGDKPLKETCDDIHWQGRQCQALKDVEWAKANGLSPQVVEGYYSLPEDER